MSDDQRRDSEKAAREQMRQAIEQFERSAGAMAATCKAVNEQIDQLALALARWGQTVQKQIDEAAAKIKAR